jgi:tetratricopeptide (TPR) repeat protein
MSLEALLALGQFAEAKNLADSIGTESIPSKLYVKILAKSGHDDEAREILRTIDLQEFDDNEALEFSRIALLVSEETMGVTLLQKLPEEWTDAQLLLAQVHFNQNRPSDAITHLDKVPSEFRTDPFYLALWSSYVISSGKSTDVDPLVRISQNISNSRDARWQAAIGLLKTGHYGAAYEAMLSVIKENWDSIATIEAAFNNLFKARRLHEVRELSDLVSARVSYWPHRDIWNLIADFSREKRPKRKYIADSRALRVKFPYHYNLHNFAMALEAVYGRLFEAYKIHRRMRYYQKTGSWPPPTTPTVGRPR